MVHSSKIRGGAARGVSVALLVAMAASTGAATAQAAAGPPVANLAAQVLKISGRTFGGGAVIPKGVSLEKVSLTTADPDSGPQGPLGLSNDPFTLVQGEAVTVRVNGAVVATTVPPLRAASLQTDAGTFTVLVFNAGGNAYAIPQYNQPIVGVTRTVARSRLNESPVGSTVTYWYGLLPENARVLHGTAFSQVTEFGTVTSSGPADYLLYDADAVRGSGDSIGDEVALRDLGGAPSNGVVGRLALEHGTEVLATIAFENGAFLVARAVRYDSFGPYSTTSSYLVDAAALAAAGQSIRTIATVVSSSPVAHDLNWEALGFRP
jgi:hypothetical protein